MNLLKTLYDNGTPIKTIAEQWQVSRTTIYRYLNKLEDKEDENKEKYLTNFSEAKRKEATQKYNIIKPFILGNQSLSSISKNKDIALSTLYRWNKLYKEEGLTGLIHTLLDIYILDQTGNINRPWLTIIMDDYSQLQDTL